MDPISALVVGGLFLGGNWLYSKATGTDFKENVKKSSTAIKNKAVEIAEKTAKSR